MIGSNVCCLVPGDIFFQIYDIEKDPLPFPHNRNRAFPDQTTHCPYRSPEVRCGFLQGVKAFRQGITYPLRVFNSLIYFGLILLCAHYCARPDLILDPALGALSRTVPMDP